MQSKVSGQIWFDESAGPFTGAVLRVRLEEVSRADAAAREITNLVMRNCSHAPGDPPVDFTLRSDSINPQLRYEIRVHLDLNDSRDYSVGDQLTTQSYPVLTQGYPDTVQIRLQRVE